MSEEERADLARRMGIPLDADWETRLADDARDTLAWIVERQEAGETIVALRDKDIALLNRSDDVEGARDCLVSYLAVPTTKRTGRTRRVAQEDER